MNRKYVLKLTADERDWLEGIVRTGKSAAWKIRHANAFLKMDCGEHGPSWGDGHCRSLWHEHAQPGYRPHAITPIPETERCLSFMPLILNILWRQLLKLGLNVELNILWRQLLKLRLDVEPRRFYPRARYT